jgi:hypothetical protein
MGYEVFNQQEIADGIDITISLYDQVTGDKIKDSISLNLEKANPGTYTAPMAIRMFANGATQIKNIKLCISSGSPQIPGGGGTANADGSVSVGNFGVEHGQTLEEKTALTSFFSAFNLSNTQSDDANVEIGNMTENSSEFVYLNAKMPEQIGEGHVVYRWFFDFVE